MTSEEAKHRRLVYQWFDMYKELYGGHTELIVYARLWAGLKLHPIAPKPWLIHQAHHKFKDGRPIEAQ